MNHSRSPQLQTFITLLWLLLVITGCGLAEPEPTPTATQPLIMGLAISNLANPFFVSMQTGAREAAIRLNIQLVIEDAGDDPTLQKSQLESLITRPVSALLINPVDSESLAPTLEAANQAGIPVFTVDRAINSPFVIAHITSDNVVGGKMAADYVSELLQGSGNVVELQGLPGTSAAEDRGAGFAQGLTPFSEITIIAQVPADFNRQTAETVFAQILAEQPDIDAVFAQNDEMILGAIAAAKGSGRDNNLFFVGFDASDEAIAALEAGDLDATIAQQPSEMGRLVVETALQHLNGQSVAKLILADLALITH